MFGIISFVYGRILLAGEKSTCATVESDPDRILYDPAATIITLNKIGGDTDDRSNNLRCKSID